MPEGFRTLYFDPGEDFGWAVANEFNLMARGITKMWETAQQLGDDIEGYTSIFNDANSGFEYDDVDPELFKLPIERIVCEDFRIYPWKLKQLKFNPVRTARVIGAVTYLCQRHNIDLVLQPAAIKKAAVAAGAEELYDTPLHENRHSNDALQHYVFYTNTALKGIHIPVPNEGADVDDGIDD